MSNTVTPTNFKQIAALIMVPSFRVRLLPHTPLTPWLTRQLGQDCFRFDANHLNAGEAGPRKNVIHIRCIFYQSNVKCILWRMLEKDVLSNICNRYCPYVVEQSPLGYKQMITSGFYGFAEANYMSYGKPSFSVRDADGSTQSSSPSLNSYQALVGVGYKF